MSFFATFELPPKEGDSTGTAGSAEDLDRLDLLAGAISGECKDDDDEAMGSSGAGFDAAGGGFDPSDLQSAMASLRAEEHEAKGGAGAKGGDEDMGVGGGAGGAAAVAEAKDGPAPVRFDVPMAKGDRPKPESKRELRARVERAKSNSTSTVFLKSTISVPDVDKILLGVSALLSKMIVPCENFDEDPFVQCLPWMTRQKLALQAGGRVEDWCETIFFFMKKAFAIAQWSPESNVIALVLVTRLIGSTEITFNEANWDKVLLCAFLLAQKLWDDTPLANVDFPLLCQQIHGAANPEFDVTAVNQMEKLFLSELHFDIHVDRTCYTQFYFELYALTGDSEERTALLPSITEANAARLEARSTSVQEQLDRARGQWRGGFSGVRAAAGKRGMASTVALDGSINKYSPKGGRLILE